MMIDSEDKAKIEKIIADRKKAHSFYKSNSAVYRAFLGMEEAAFSGEGLPKKMRELIAVGISVTLNCESCMEWHVRESLEAGASRDEVLDAVGVGIEMGGGPATVAARFAMKVLEYYRDRAEY
jgi:AhpD family alkylhydroperoxidase